MIYSYHLLPKETEHLRLPVNAISRFVDVFVKKSSIIVATSPFCKKVVIENGGKKPIATISPGISNNIMPDKEKRRIFRERFGIKDELVFYCVAPPTEKKGLSDFIKVANQINNENVKFMWVGRLFPHLKVNYTLENLKEKHPEIIFTGYVENISEVHNAGDILLFPSVYEGFGIPIVEAGACKNPAIIRNIESFSWLKSGKDCLKFNDSEELSELVSEIIEKKSMLRKMAKGAEDMSRRHRLNFIKKYYERLYELCCEKSYEEANEINSYGREV